MLNYSLFGLNLLLEEAKLNYRSSFETVLDLMSSPVAKDLLLAQNKDIEVDVNNIGSTETEDVVSFTSPKKFDSKIVWKAIKQFSPIQNNSNVFSALGVNPPVKYWITTGDMFTIEKELSDSECKAALGIRDVPSFKLLKIKNITSGDEFAIPNGKEIYNHLEKTDEVFPKVRHQEIKVGRLTNKILLSIGRKFSHKEIEEFVNEFKSKVSFLKDNFRNFELVKGDLIKFYYDEKNYDTTKLGTLHSSCMRYPECSKFFKIYSENPEVCKLLIMRSDKFPEKICARALVWTTINGDTFIDRVYYSKESDPNLFKEYAEKMEWYHKIGSSGILTKGKEKIKSAKVKLSKWEFNYYPFVDTIFSLNTVKGTLSDLPEKNCVVLQDTGGGTVNECDECGGEGSISCDVCRGDGNIECPDCDGEGSNECDSCDGEGKIDCKCNGDPNCDYCDGKGKIDCKDCDEGKSECSKCYGEGTIECEECGGDGNYDCPECN